MSGKTRPGGHTLPLTGESQKQGYAQSFPQSGAEVKPGRHVGTVEKLITHVDCPANLDGCCVGSRCPLFQRGKPFKLCGTQALDIYCAHSDGSKLGTIYRVTPDLLRIIPLADGHTIQRAAAQEGGAL